MILIGRKSFLYSVVLMYHLKIFKSRCRNIPQFKMYNIIVYRLLKIKKKLGNISIRSITIYLNYEINHDIFFSFLYTLKV